MRAYAHIKPMTDPKTIAQTCIMQALRSTARMITQRYEDALRSEDLTASQFTILAAISVQSGIKVTTLAERVGMDRTTLNRVLAPLQRRGLVRLEASREDARAKAVHLDVKGKATFERAVPLWEKAQVQTLQHIDATALADLRASLKALRE